MKRLSPCSPPALAAKASNAVQVVTWIPPSRQVWGAPIVNNSAYGAQHFSFAAG